MDTSSSEPDVVDWRLAKACVTGSSHRALGQDGQDRLATAAVRTGCGEMVAIAAVADGAGSARHSGAAAELAVDGFTDCVLAALRRTRVADLLESVVWGWLVAMRDEVLAAAAKAGVPADEYSCTFLAVVAGEERAIFLQIGDGLIAVRNEDAVWELACTPQRGEYANQTWFLTSPDALERAAARFWPGRISAFALSTDGLESVCLDRATGTPFSGFFDSLTATVEATPDMQVEQLDKGLERFLASERLEAYTSDDKTLVLAVRSKA